MSATPEQRELVRKQAEFAEGMAAAGAHYNDLPYQIERDNAEALRAVLADSERLQEAERGEVRRRILYEYLRWQGEKPRDSSPSNLADRLATAALRALASPATTKEA